MLLLSYICLCLLLLSACSKCEVCAYTNDRGEQIEANESCGSKNKKSDFKNTLEKQWSSFGEVNCIEV